MVSLWVEMERNPVITLPPAVYPRLSDAQLVLLTRAGVSAAYDALVQRYRGAVCLTAMRYVTPEIAQDVAQEVFLIAHRALTQLESPEKFAGWLRMIARHRAERWGRREGRQETADASMLERRQEPVRADDCTHPEEHCLRKERQQQVWYAIERLSDTHREVILLHHIEEWPLSRIAAFLSLSEDVVRGRLFRARAALRQLLQEKRK